MVMQVIVFSLDRIIEIFMLIYLILEENNIYRKSSHFFFFFLFYEGKLPAFTIKLFDDMEEIKKEKFALHCNVSLKSALHYTVSNFLYCTISLLLMFLGWKLDSYCFAGRDLAFWDLAYLVIQLQDEESQVFTSLSFILYYLLHIYW